MDTFIYLDQNALSDLRIRKRENQTDKSAERLYAALSEQGNGSSVVYSSTHLDEIRQIEIQEYIDEHIDLLGGLNAIYIEPLTAELNAKKPILVWEAYLENEKDNIKNGANESANIIDQLSRKFSGLDVESSFDELHTMLVDNVRDSITQIEKMLSEATEQEISSHQGRQMKLMLTQLKEQAKGLEASSPFEIEEGQELGPKPVQSHMEVEKLGLENLSPKNVIPAIDRLFATENPEYRWEDYFDNTVHNQIARCYTLMNWVGYYADDFTKVRKRGDRFRTSTNDLMHVRSAAGAAFLVSNDKAFIKKATACYAHLGVPTIVLTVDEIVKKLNL